MNLHYTERGEGKTLILLHGNGSSHEYLSHQIDFFSKNYHVYAIDTRGHGKSPRGTAPFTLRQFADDLFAFCKQHKIEKTNILGHSDGGNIALLFALRHPEMIDRMILASANFTPNGLRTFFRLPVKIGLTVTSALENKSEKAKKKAALLRLMTDEPHISVNELQTINAKTLIISATFDIIKESHTKLLHDSINNSVWVKIKGDHGLPHSRPNEFNKTIALFLNKS